MVGHKFLVKNFKALAASERLPHAYLFYGPEGVGKKTFALAFANFLEKGVFDFETIGMGVLGDLFLVSPNEKKTIGIDEVRGIRRFLSSRPNQSTKRTVIIDEAEFLTTEAQNALLKTTEEPPESALLILIARDPEIFMATLGSRLQKVYFSALKPDEVREGLEEVCSMKHVTCNTKEIEEVVRISRGSLGLAMKMLSSDKWNETRKAAEKFIKVSGTERREFIKKILEPEDFDILNFLDAITLVISNQLQNTDDLRIYGSSARIWHRVLRLRQDFSNSPLNPKLQLQALLNYE